MSIMTEIHLDKFQPRPYQLAACDAFENRGFKKMLLVWGRRSGKDIVCWNLMIRQAVRKVGVYMYALPTFSQGRKVIWDSITNDGMRFIDFIPPELVKATNSQELKITLVNGSIIQIIGSDSYDTSLVGTNPRMLVFSEFALADPDAFKFVMPIINANGGSVIIVSTPRGKNEFWNMYNISQYSSEWFCQKLSLADTKHIPIEMIQQDIDDGLVSPDLVQQEYYCSFDQGAEGSYYAKYIDKLRLNGQIGKVRWEPQFRVSTAFDIGVRDSTCIIFFQIIGQVVHIIDCYEKNKEGLEHYVNIVMDKPYQYDKHWAPHDIAVKEFGSGLTRLEKAKQLGLKFETREAGTKSALPMLSIEDGIEAVRSALPKMWFDEERCKPLIRALENYRQEFDEKRKVYREKPLHDNNCFVGDTLLLTRTGMRRIMDVNIGDELLTLKGWKKCKASWMSKENADLVEVTFQDGTKVKCTPEHLFLTENGWKSAESLTKNTVIQSSSIQSQHTSQDHCIKYGPMKSISLGADQDYIEMSGSLLSVQFHQNVIYTTRTMIQKTIDLITWNVYQGLNILSILDLMERDCLSLQGIRLQNGIVLKKEENGILIKRLDANHGRSENEFQWNVFSVEEYLKDWLIKGRIVKNSAIPTAKPLIIESVRLLNEKQNVYDIEVEDAHHFSLANGAIVHNSHYADAFRYLVLSLSRSRDEQSTAEDIEKRYRQAQGYGSDGLGIGQGFFNDNHRIY